jgi:DNA-binding response OmpR family regulator
MRRNTMLIEDDDCRRVDVLHQLTPRGHRVIACASVSDAEEIVRDVQLSTMAPDIVILLLWLSQQLGQVAGPDG